MIPEKLLHEGHIETIDTLIILGSGMSGCYLPDEYEVIAEHSGGGVVGHTGRIALLRRDDRTFLLALGRRHFYEGYRGEDVAGIVGDAAVLGAKNLVVTNAAGGLDPRFQAGDIMLIEDYIGTMLGRRMASAPEGPKHTNGFFYSRHRSPMFAVDYYPEIERRAFAGGLALQRGIYAGVPGPSYETRAEIGMLRDMGGNAVGMSTIPEVAGARRYTMQTVGLSLITNTLTDTERVVLDHLDVVEQGTIGQIHMRIAIDAAIEALKPL